MQRPCILVWEENASRTSMVRVIPINWDCEDKELEIPRYKLVNFDEDEHIKYIEDESVRNFVMGMLDFAEWDVGTRRSYYWPEFIKTLVSSPKQLYDWCRMAENHVVYVFFGSKKRRLHMFILCLQHIGLLEDTIESSDGWGTCSSIRETVTQLMQSAICTEDISVEKCERNCVRVGDMYQVDVPAFDPNRPPSPVNLSDNSEQIYSPDNDVADEEIDKYLGILRNRITSCEGVVVSTVKMTKSTQARHPNLLEHLKHETNVKNIFIKASKYRLNVATCCVMGQAETLGGIEPFADAPTTSFDLMVTDGTNRWRTPVNYVYLRGFHEDVALSILHAAKYNSAAALKDPKLLAFDELLHCPLWTPDQLKFFKSKTEIYGTNVRKVWEKMNKAFRISRPIKSVVDMYYSLYPEAERESARSDASAMSVSRSVSQSTSYQAAPVATKKVLRANPSNYPNRWPSHLPLTRDNLYGLRSSNTPCVCLTLEIPSGNAEAMMRVIPINTTTYHHEVCLNASQIIPLTQEMLNISDARTAEFVLAMRDFALWERSLHPECVWYLYPSFLLNMIKKPTEWSSWRKRYERAARGSNDNKQNIYFNGLIETHKLMADTDDRDMSATFPWDDSPILPPQPKTSQPVHLVHSADQKACTLPPLPSMSSYTHPTTVASNLSPLQIQVPRAPSVSSTSSTPKITEDRKRRGNGSASSESSPKPRLRNETNLFWLANNELPGIFYGYEVCIAALLIMYCFTIIRAMKRKISFVCCHSAATLITMMWRLVQLSWNL